MIRKHPTDAIPDLLPLADDDQQDRLAPAILRYAFSYFSASTSFKRDVLEDDLCELLIGHIRWPEDAKHFVAAPKTTARRRFCLEEDEEDGGASEGVESVLDPIDAALSRHQRGFVQALRDLGEQHPQWLRGVFARSLAALDDAPSAVGQRLASLRPLFGWSEIDVGVAELAWHASRDGVFCEWLDNLPGTSRDACPAYARVLGISRHLLRPSLAANGPLVRSGLVLFDRRSLGFRNPPRLNASLMRALDEPEFSPSCLAESLLPECPDPELGPSDFAHLADEVDALALLLRQATEGGCRGVNLLIYGPPGTGKTQLARWLVNQSLLHGYEIPTTETDERSQAPDDQPASCRLGLLRSAQRLLGQAEDAVLLFDECEDAFPPPRLGGLFGNEPENRKGWINEVLENCPVPIIWIGNAVHHMDPAFLRRFTYHLEVPRPPLQVRRRMTAARAQCQGLPAVVAAPLAEFADASPAMIDSALRFARLASREAADGVPSAGAAGLALRALKASLSVCGLETQAAARRSATVYDPSYVNLRPALPVDELVASLKPLRQAHLLLYGVPGTGKTCFAEHLAEQLDRPLQVKRASDLQSKYVGDCEKNIRKMFDEAQREGAVLLLDEADAFLYDRQSAQHAWQRSQVNELLQDMERFEGVFIAATNLIETIDSAALRRFTYKLEFLPLNPAQRNELFVRCWPAPLSEGELGEIARGLSRLDGVTAGDIAVVARQNRSRRTPMPVDAALQLVAGELALRRGPRCRQIGFLG